MFFSRKLEAFMAVVENGSLSKAARVMNRTTPPIAKSIKDFETSLGKRLFKREKFGMTLTKDGQELYNDLRDLYLQEKEITKKHFSGYIINEANIYYDWGKENHLINLYQSAHQNNVQVNILRFNYDEVDEIVDYDGNTLILSSEQVVSERFSLQKIIENSPLGIYCRKELYEKFHYDLVTLLQKSTWLCDPAFYKSSLMSDLLAKIETVDNKTSVRQMDNIGCCQSFIQEGDFIGIIDHYPEEELIDKSLIYISLNKILGKSVCYIYKSKSHSSVLNRFMGVVDKLGGEIN
ncbi:LysR family transcriptional regulator [Providencia huaxiensis]|uniref:LysR family transcriptional regulator n=2 Tax=Providencia huaxiensis TaxID=2027290 RepID=A0A8I2DAH3_9GAMM|nr:MULTISPECIES: LysR family transcriptional regulator [Providencia]MBN6360577.1 LysR family transcriptional regulator [Providencia huaxiensis]MBQ0267336.1 LysR family transcriptional regulator [Providencia huaxiensis]MBQ0536128.1 LysR family transcriptional regulator [Providencia huaxiensis]MBQ0589351.1 LysR family transcriptional regulator [Providencia huaxiensis]MCD2527124.1 LysR family transcriptional regulator [Providencia huaxiensis]